MAAKGKAERRFNNVKSAFSGFRLQFLKQNVAGFGSCSLAQIAIMSSSNSGSKYTIHLLDLAGLCTEHDSEGSKTVVTWLPYKGLCINH